MALVNDTVEAEMSPGSNESNEKIVNESNEK